MPYEIEPIETVSRETEREMRATWPSSPEGDLPDEHGTYDVHLLIRDNGKLTGWAAVRFAPARMTADITVLPGAGSTRRVTFLLDALRALGDSETSIEWWARGKSIPPARRVANAISLPRHRKIIRMERSAVPAGSDLHVRSFGADDAAEVVRVNNAAFLHHPDQFDMTEEKLHSELARRNASRADLLLTHVGRRLVGFAWTLPRSAQYCEIHLLAVDPEFQGRGLGRRLLDAAIDHLVNNYAPATVFLYVDSTDKFAIGMYKRHGFEDVRQPLVSHLA